MTQVESARRGEVTDEIRAVADKESRAPGFIVEGLAGGTIVIPVNLIRGQSTPGEGRGFVGYKGMFDIYQQIRNPLYFFMAVSFSLGILNLFPIPALDGGRILLTLPEILLRRRIPPRYENMIHLIGFAVLLILLIYINVQDFVNPITFP